MHLVFHFQYGGERQGPKLGTLEAMVQANQQVVTPHRLTFVEELKAVLSMVLS